MTAEETTYDTKTVAQHTDPPAAGTRGERYGDKLFNTVSASELRRLLALAETFDPGSQQRLSSLGVTAGWRCLEVGAGPGTLARWLAEAVGPDGEVVALDKDTRLRDPRSYDNLRVVQADVTTQVPDLGRFDLVHARFLLTHLPERTRVMRRLTEWVAPGGWLVVTDPTDASTASSTHEAYRRTFAALWRTLNDKIGTEIDYGRTYPQPLRTCGLTEINIAVDLLIVVGASPFARFWRDTLNEVRPAFISTGLLDEASLDATLAYLNDPQTRELGLAAITAWGRKPIDHSAVASGLFSS